MPSSSGFRSTHQPADPFHPACPFLYEFSRWFPPYVWRTAASKERFFIGCEDRPVPSRDKLNVKRCPEARTRGGKLRDENLEGESRKRKAPKGESLDARKPGKEVGSQDLGGEVRKRGSRGRRSEARTWGGKLERENPPGGELGSKKLGRGFGRQEARSREAVLGGLVLESVPNVKKCLGEAAPIPPEGPAGI